MNYKRIFRRIIRILHRLFVRDENQGEIAPKKEYKKLPIVEITNVSSKKRKRRSRRVVQENNKTSNMPNRLQVKTLSENYKKNTLASSKKRVPKKIISLIFFLGFFSSCCKHSTSRQVRILPVQELTIELQVYKPHCIYKVD